MMRLVAQPMLLLKFAVWVFSLLLIHQGRTQTTHFAPVCSCAIQGITMKIIHPHRGFATLGVVIAIGILGAMSAALSVMVATNQKTRTQQLYSDQAYYSAHAALEFAMRQIRIDGNP